jgi:predicted ATPase/class 3 adenylate cyclase
LGASSPRRGPFPPQSWPPGRHQVIRRNNIHSPHDLALPTNRTYSPVVVSCSRCGRPNRAGARFCDSCGSALTAAPARREVRKTVTIVRSDLTSSTALGERLDPESLRHVLARYFDAMSVILERHGAVVEKFIGDAVMAVFGVPAVHEDDALRALRAASEMREALASLNDELRRNQGVEIEIRIGVTTGDVLAGDPSFGQAFVTGDAPNLAARLEEAARPGEIIMAAETYRLVRDAVVAERLEPLRLKGKAEPVTAFRLQSVLPAGTPSARRLEAPLVGREHELRLLTDAFERAVRDRTCHLLTVMGAAGVGKSRLIVEFLASLGERARVARGRCLPYGEVTGLRPLVEVVNDLAGLRGDEPSDQARDRISAILAGEEDPARVAEWVAQLVGLTETTTEGAEIFWAIRRLFEAVGRRQPLIVVLEDLERAQPALFDAIEYVADLSRDVSMLLICLARPELLEARPVWAGGKLNTASLLLEPLSDEECKTMIHQLLGQRPLDSAASRLLIEATEGNPLFLEEMLAILVEEGALSRRTRTGKLTNLSLVTAPPSIHALFQARLDQLPQHERRVLECASIEGRHFHRSAVLHLAPEFEETTLEAHLVALVRKDLIRPDQPSFAPDEAFRFRHLLVREAAYESLPKETRAGLHERFTEWLERRAGERATEYEEIVGYHLEQATRYLDELGPRGEASQALAHRASVRLASAARRASLLGDVHAAIAILDRACSLLPPDDPSRLSLLPELASLLGFRQFDRAEAALAEAEKTARDMDDKRVGALVRLLRLRLRLRVDPEGKAEAVRAEAERAIPIFTQFGDDGGLALAWRLKGHLDFLHGRFSAWRTALEQALVHARRAGDEREETRLIQQISSSHLWGATPVQECLGYATDALSFARDRGNRIREGLAFLQLALGHAMLGRFDEAREYIARDRGLAEEFGLTQLADETRGHVEMLAENWEAAEKSLRSIYSRLQQAGERATFPTVAAHLAETLYRQGRYDEALHLTKASESAAAIDNVAPQMLWRAIRSKVLAQRGDLEDAERLAREAVFLGEDTEMLNERAAIVLDLAEVLQLEGSTEAATALKEGLRLYEEKGNVVGADRALGRLKSLNGEEQDTN